MLLRDLAKMAPEQKKRAVADLVRRSREPANGAVDAKLAELEQQYGMTTAEMHAKLKAGQIGDTPDTARWLALASLRG